MIELKDRPHDRSVNFFKQATVKKPAKRVNPVSEKRKREGRTYSGLRKSFLKDHSECQIKWNDECGKKATQIHHVKGRGKFYLDTETWLGSCSPCHRKAHDNPKEAKKRGIIIFAP